MILKAFDKVLSFLLQEPNIEMFFYLLTWLSTIIHIIFVTLSLAAGLYYIAEVVEEYTVMTAKVIKYITIASMVVNVGLLMFEGLPLYLTGIGFLTSFDHLLLLKDFPNISVTSIPFIIASGMVFVNHYLSFKYFGMYYHPFPEVLTYFTLCQWLVPFAFFVSLSINESTLPTTNTVVNTSNGNIFTKPKRSGILGIFDYVSEKKDNFKENVFGRDHMY